MKIQILGTGCPKCKKLGELADQAAKEMGLEYEIEKVTGIADIMEFGVMTTPAPRRGRQGALRRACSFVREGEGAASEGEGVSRYTMPPLPAGFPLFFK